MLKLVFANALIAVVLAADVFAADTAEDATIAAPLGNAIAYQGRLEKNGAPVNGNCNFAFALWDALSGGTQIGVTVNVSSQPVAMGLFSVSLDFGAGAFNGQARWLSIQVMGPGEGSFTTLTPRQAIHAAPYSLYSLGGPGGVGSQWVTGPDGQDLSYTGGGVAVTGASSPFPAGRGVYIEGYGTVGQVFAYNYSTSAPMNLSLNSPGGNVGIGTATPTSKLEIAAQDGLAISGASPFMTLNDTSAGNVESYVRGFAGDIGLVPSGLPGGSTALYAKRNTGRVGVGTINPAAMLHAVSFTSSVPAVSGTHASNWIGVYGESETNAGVWGKSWNGGFGVYGEAAVASGVGGYFRNLAGGEALHVDGKAVVKTLQILGGADIVEGFETGDAVLEPGTVVVIDDQHPGELRASARAYDNRVAGVVSGAGGVAPGLRLGQERVMDGETSVAMTGRVYARCSVQGGRIRPGDLLTTSDHTGLAMRAGDPARSNGAILGKAMSGLDSGTGLVLVLVNLQ